MQTAVLGQHAFDHLVTRRQCQLEVKDEQRHQIPGHRDIDPRAVFEEHPQRDGQGQVAHLKVRVDELTGLPFLSFRDRSLGHGPEVGGQSIAVEERLDDPAPAPVVLAVAGDDGRAVQHCVALVNEPLLERRPVLVDHGFDQFGVEDDAELEKEDPIPSDAPVLAMQPSEQPERVPEPRDQVAKIVPPHARRSLRGINSRHRHVTSSLAPLPTLRRQCPPLSMSAPLSRSPRALGRVRRRR